MDKRMKSWQDCVDFHGHSCGGLTIGYNAALYAIELLGLTFSEDEEIVCISENDACGVDAIQVMLGCSIGKGNLKFHMTGKQAFSFYVRSTGRSARLILKPKPAHITRETSLEYYQSKEPEELFDVTETRLPMPEKAERFDSHICAECGEMAGEKWMRNEGGKWICGDCGTD